MWALGVSLYEMIYLRYPFGATNKKEYKKQVIDSEIKFEQVEGYEKLIDICKSLLQRTDWITASKLLNEKLNGCEDFWNKSHEATLVNSNIYTVHYSKC